MNKGRAIKGRQQPGRTTAFWLCPSTIDALKARARVECTSMSMMAEDILRRALGLECEPSE